ncbi:MAG TPA: sulfite oxidase-like oxidoreductase [Thermoanaerobaculia bacterium]|nr:sulfite oxidase-like oxidoreductase [Thermoanaerobaculia bacterium]
MDDRPRTGPDRAPPGQYVTDKWPVLTYGETPTVDLDSFRLRVGGAVGARRELDWAALQSLPRVEVSADFHCVTRFSTLDNRWSGFATRSVLEGAAIDPEATHVLVRCVGGYTTNLPLEDFLSERALLADRHGGEPLAAEHGGPLRLVVPHLYAWKSAKWIAGLELLTADQRGFWERNGYHTYGDPWTEQRFSSQETHAAHQVRRRARELGLRLD